MHELLQAYPGEIIESYRVSQDIKEGFICKIAPGRRRTRSSVEILELTEIEIYADEEFTPFGLDGVVF